MDKKEQLCSIFSKGFLNSQIKNLIERVGTANIYSLFLHHLPREYKILMKTLSEVDRYNLISLLKDYLLNKDFECKINENIFEQKSEIFKELTSSLQSKIDIFKNFDIYDAYQIFISFIKTISHIQMLMIFKTMGIDIYDDNVVISNGSLGTPGRIIKMWIGKNIFDLTEPLSGRFAIEPELVIFPCEKNKSGKPVTISLTINAVCSHHLVRFGNEFGNNKSRAIISYIPKDKVLGLSKINRWVEWVVRRGWLQEDLTTFIGKTLKEKLSIDDIYVGLINMQHGCVSFRGKNDTLSYTTTEYYSGKYEDVNFRNQILSTIL